MEVVRSGCSVADGAMSRAQHAGVDHAAWLLQRAQVAVNRGNPLDMLEDLTASGYLDGLRRRLQKQWSALPSSEVDECVAQAVDAACAAASQGRPISALGAWLWKTAANIANDRWRADYSRRQEFCDDAADADFCRDFRARLPPGRALYPRRRGGTVRFRRRRPGGLPGRECARSRFFPGPPGRQHHPRVRRSGAWSGGTAAARHLLRAPRSFGRRRAKASRRSGRRCRRALGRGRFVRRPGGVARGRARVRGARRRRVARSGGGVAGAAPAGRAPRRARHRHRRAVRTARSAPMAGIRRDGPVGDRGDERPDLARRRAQPRCLGAWRLAAAGAGVVPVRRRRLPSTLRAGGR